MKAGANFGFWILDYDAAGPPLTPNSQLPTPNVFMVKRRNDTLTGVTWQQLTTKKALSTLVERRETTWTMPAAGKG